MGEEKECTVPGSPEIKFEPVVKLHAVKTDTHEGDEDEILKLRAKLYRYVVDLEDGPQWKERGVGEVKILRHKSSGKCRIIMRRDKTLKICANHHITPVMKLKPHASSEKAFVWNTMADYADGEGRQETLAIRLKGLEDATLFKEKFEECVNSGSETGDNSLPDLLSELKVKDASGDDNKSDVSTVDEKKDSIASPSNVDGDQKEKKSDDVESRKGDTSDSSTSKTSATPEKEGET